jgi:regulatory protein
LTQLFIYPVSVKIVQPTQLRRTITGIEWQQKNKERVNIFLDGEYAFSLAALSAQRLKKGQQLSAEEIAGLQQQDQNDKAFEQAIRFLGFRPRSKKEIELYLQKKGVPVELAQATIEHLQASGYVNDDEFARFWVENRQQFRPRGSLGLRYELRQKGVAENIIRDALQEINEEELAWQTVESHLRQWQNLKRGELYQKMAAYLSRRGFNYEIIHSIFERAWQLRLSSGTNEENEQ